LVHSELVAILRPGAKEPSILKQKFDDSPTPGTSLELKGFEISRGERPQPAPASAEYPIATDDDLVNAQFTSQENSG
jgi:hypothetical protein